MTRCRCTDGRLLLETRQGEKAIALEAVLEVRLKEGLFLTSVVLVTEGERDLKLSWIWKKDAVLLLQAHRDVLWRTRFNQLRKRVESFLQSRWPRYKQALLVWRAALQPGRPVPEDKVPAWLRAHRNLALPGPLGNEAAGHLPENSGGPDDPQNTAGAPWLRMDSWNAEVARWHQEVRRSFQEAVESYLPADPQRGTTRREFPDVKQLREQVDSFLRNVLPHYEHTLVAWKGTFSRGLYVTHSEIRQLQKAAEAPDLSREIDHRVRNLLPAEYKEVLAALRDALRDARQRADQWNGAFVRAELRSWKAFFDGIEKYPLTPQQRKAIVREEDNNLVIAGAGTGNTESP